eukprot:Blabericola_migrator_1__8892@NODE_46_length_16830_cov_132_783392_g42_i0_p11_GENE_NODE_46_length_16830_cov_132_783392_g42_i0NODE_46_length_16830_cov_132_783392_g42_i0_p11_ORF_typecomplete_len206_score13_72Pex19/PF04614_12/0_21Pex19/PF04614_12/1_7e03_NODE_46_length_16830_cov_132_783392_g42_i087169333
MSPSRTRVCSACTDSGGLLAARSCSCDAISWLPISKMSCNPALILNVALALWNSGIARRIYNSVQPTIASTYNQATGSRRRLPRSASQDYLMAEMQDCGYPPPAPPGNCNTHWCVASVPPTFSPKAWAGGQPQYPPPVLHPPNNTCAQQAMPPHQRPPHLQPPFNHSQPDVSPHSQHQSQGFEAQVNQLANKAKEHLSKLTAKFR